MFYQESESIELDCDAPPYPIVRACRWLDYRSPEDVRWCHLSHVPKPTRRPRQVFSWQAWKSLFAKGAAPSAACTCGEALPQLEPCTITMRSGQQVRFLFGQCQRCHTMYWREA